MSKQEREDRIDSIIDELNDTCAWTNTGIVNYLLLIQELNQLAPGTKYEEEGK